MASYPWSSALVTGASSGIGAEMVRLLAAAGVPTTVVARRAERLEAQAKEFDGIEVLPADLMSADGVRRVAARLTDAARPVDLLVNNAGVGNSGAFVELDPARIDDEVNLNVAALTRLTRAALDLMVAARRGWVLNVSSVASFQSGPHMAVYAATKAYVTSFSESLHLELKADGVVVTALCPGLTRTEFQLVAGSDGLGSRVPSFGWTDVKDVARTGLADCAKGRVLSVPGLQYKTLTALSDVSPRWLTRRIAAVAMRYR
jgi:short-subunit dehydrogenase